MLMNLPPNCTVENAAELKTALLAAVAPGENLTLDATGVEKADVTVFQLLHCLERELAVAGGRLAIHAQTGALADEARAAGLESWFGQFASLQED